MLTHTQKHKKGLTTTARKRKGPGQRFLMLDSFALVRETQHPNGKRRGAQNHSSCETGVSPHERYVSGAPELLPDVILAELETRDFCSSRALCNPDRQAAVEKKTFCSSWPLNIFIWTCHKRVVCKSLSAFCSFACATAVWQ